MSEREHQLFNKIRHARETKKTAESNFGEQTERGFSKRFAVCEFKSKFKKFIPFEKLGFESVIQLLKEYSDVHSSTRTRFELKNYYG